MEHYINIVTIFNRIKNFIFKIGKLKIFVVILSISSVIGIYAGLFQDVFYPLYHKFLIKSPKKSFSYTNLPIQQISDKIEEICKSYKSKYGLKSVVAITYKIKDRTFFGGGSSGKYLQVALDDYNFTIGGLIKPFIFSSIFTNSIGIGENTLFYNENGVYRFEDKVIIDPKRHGWLSASQIIKCNSNIGTFKILEASGINEIKNDLINANILSAGDSLFPSSEYYSIATGSNIQINIENLINAYILLVKDKNNNDIPAKNNKILNKDLIFMQKYKYGLSKKEYAYLSNQIPTSFYNNSLKISKNDLDLLGLKLLSNDIDASIAIFPVDSPQYISLVIIELLQNNRIKLSSEYVSYSDEFVKEILKQIFSI